MATAILTRFLFTFLLFQLWKYQQQHRATLENESVYGLKRWQVGEIASKIGQLYYHYYLRTSETAYLQESYVFYEAIRSRNYFKDVSFLSNPALFVKELRYLARFLLVCILSSRRALARKLIQELDARVFDYRNKFADASDIAEWTTVLAEFGAFINVRIPWPSLYLY